MPISSLSIRKIVQPFLKQWVRKGLAGTEMLKIIRQEFGQAYRLEVFYADIRRYRKALEKVSSILATPKRLRFKEEDYLENDLLAEKYAHDIEIIYRDPETGEERRTMRRVYSQQRLTRGRAEEKAKEMFLQSPDKPGYEFLETGNIELYYNPNL